jgi:hypothetical protein
MIDKLSQGSDLTYLRGFRHLHEFNLSGLSDISGLESEHKSAVSSSLQCPNGRILQIIIVIYHDLSSAVT